MQTRKPISIHTSAGQFTSIASIIAFLMLVSPVSGQSTEKIKLVGQKSFQVKVVSMTAEKVAVTVRGKKTVYPRWQIESIDFADQPSPLWKVRKLANERNFPGAHQAITKAKWGKSKVNSKLEVLYTVSMVRAELALSGNNLSTHASALKTIESFLKQCNDTHYRISDVVFLKARVLAGEGKIDQAISTLKEFASKAKGELVFDYQLRLGILLLSNGKLDEAKSAFSTAIQSTKRTGNSLQIAKLGLAAAESKQVGIQQTEEKIKKLLEASDPEDHQLNGFAYNFLGSAFLSAGNSKAAEVAFLHTSLLFYNNSEALPEALYQLAKIWRNNGKTTRYTEATKKLKDQFGGTYWNKKLTQ